MSPIALALAQGKAVTALLARSGNSSENRSMTVPYGIVGYPGQPQH